MLVIAAYEMRPPRRMADQTGMAVAIALLILALLSLLGITLMGLSLTESQIGSNESDLKKALFAAEGGIQEAMYRMRLPPSDPAAPLTDEGDTACTATADPVVVGLAVPSLSSGISNNWTYNPFSSPVCSWTYSGNSAIGYGNYFGGNPGTPPGDLDSAGRRFGFCAAGDTSAYCTSSTYAHKNGNQLASANITNTVSDARSYTVTVAPVVGYVGTCWQYVDQFGTPLPLAGSPVPPPCAVGAVPNNPMYKVTSIGTAKNSQKVLSTMIRRFNVNPNPDAPLTANSDVEVTSASAVVDGRNHDCNGNNPTNTDSKEAVAAPPRPPPNETQPYIDVNNTGNLVCEDGTGVGDCGTIREPFPSTIGELLLGHPYKNDTSPPPTQARLAEIDAFNAYLESIKVSTGPPENGPPFHGIVYVNGNYTQPPDGSTGILIVHNSTNTANLGNWNGGTFKGVVIADAINKINGNVTIIGAIYGWGSSSTVEVDITAGTPQIKYSKCVLDGLSQNFPFEVVKGTWHEQ